MSSRRDPGEVLAALRARAGIAAGVIAAGMLGPSPSALGASPPAPAPDAVPQNLTPEEEAQQIAEMGEPTPDAGVLDDQPAPDPEETPAGVPGSSDDELAQEPDDDSPSALVPAPDSEQGAADGTPATPQASPAPAQVTPAPAPPAGEQQAQAGAQPPQQDAKPVRSRKMPAKPKKERGRQRRQGAVTPPPVQPAPPTAPAPAQTHPDAPVRVASPAAGAPTAGGKLHVVRAGETLWSIAAQLLGDRATPEKIAALVDELWSLNASRVGSGNPDVIHTGDQLLLP